MARNPRWERDELILALDLYCRHSLLDDADPRVVELSALLGRLALHADWPDPARFRNPNGVAMKLANFAALDPAYPSVALRGGGRRDAQVWDEFAGNPAGLTKEAQAIRERARAEPLPVVPAAPDRRYWALTLNPTPTLTAGAAKQVYTTEQRPRSIAFSLKVKALYGLRCAVGGVGLRGPKGEPEVEAAHIYPKHLDGSDDPRNGLCLCRGHHWAFDVGWFAVTDDHTVVVRDDLPAGEEYDSIRRWAGQKLRLPETTEFAPHPAFLAARRKLCGFA